jgi:hypothetical protein
VWSSKRDIVYFGHRIKDMGYSVSEHPLFGGVCNGCHVANSWHYKGKAIDVNWYPSSQEGAKLDYLRDWIKARVTPTELLWRVKDHYNHLHLALV